MVGTTSRFEPGWPDRILLSIEFNDVDIDLDVCGSVGTKNRGKNLAWDGANKLVTRGGMLCDVIFSI